MRILGFSVKWEKLSNPEFTTFRLTRRDRDWEVGEVAQIVFQPRSKNREPLGIAVIISKEPRRLLTNSPHDHPQISPSEAIEDGFDSLPAMVTWLLEAHGTRASLEPLNKWTLRWVENKSP